MYINFLLKCYIIHEVCKTKKPTAPGVVPNPSANQAQRCSNSMIYAVVTWFECGWVRYNESLSRKVLKEK